MHTKKSSMKIRCIRIRSEIVVFGTYFHIVVRHFHTKHETKITKPISLQLSRQHHSYPKQWNAQCTMRLLLSIELKVLLSFFLLCAYISQWNKSQNMPTDKLPEHGSLNAKYLVFKIYHTAHSIEPKPEYRKICFSI